MLQLSAISDKVMPNLPMLQTLTQYTILTEVIKHRSKPESIMSMIEVGSVTRRLVFTRIIDSITYYLCSKLLGQSQIFSQIIITLIMDIQISE